MAFLRPSKQPPIIVPIDRREFSNELAAILEEEGEWDVYVSPTPTIDLMLIRTVQVNETRTVSPAFNPREENSLQSYQQVAMVRFAGKDEDDVELATTTQPISSSSLALIVSSVENAIKNINKWKERQYVQGVK